MTVDLTYNPFTKEKTFVVDGKNETLEECWGTEDKELSEWCTYFFKNLYRKYNDSQITVNFKGILRDFEYLEDAMNAYKMENNSIDINLVDNGCVDTSEKLGDLKKLFKKMQETTPFPQLKGDDVKDIFEKAVSSDFEIAVVATMSSGKSTLINAMLGKELLPARNEATTAVLAQIHDIDGAESFSGKSFDKDENEITTCDPLTLDKMNELNDNPETSRIEIYGDIKGIESKELKLILIDTPGPNNSRTDEHKSHTYELIKADYKPMILYVLNGTQLETNDDNSLLKDVSEAMKSFGRQSQERFIFVLNKADKFEPEKGETVQKKIEDVKKYLEKHGISNARVFPAASRLAKVIRQYQNRQSLTETEEDEILPKYKIFIKRDNKHFSNYAPLSNSAKKEMNAKLEKARKDNNPYQEALIYTGIPAIELAISEYLSKYALPFKLSEGVKSFKEKIENLKLEAEEKESLKGNQERIKYLSEKLNKLKIILENGEKASEIQNKIDNFSLQETIKKEFEDISSQFVAKITELTYKLQQPNITSKEFEASINEIQTYLNEFEPKFKVDIQTLLTNSFNSQVKNIVDEYNNYLSELIGSISDNTIKPAEILGDMASLSVDYTIDEYVKTKERNKKRGIFGAVGSVLGAGTGAGSVAIASLICSSLGPVGIGIGALVLGIAGGITGTVIPQKLLVDTESYLNEKFMPEIEAFLDSSRKIVEDWAKTQEHDFKEFFKEQLQGLNDAIKQKISEEKDCLSDKEEFEKLIKANTENLEWIMKFKSELDSILAI